MSTTPENAKAWLHVGILGLTILKVILTTFGIYVPNIEDLPTDQLLNGLASIGATYSTVKLAKSNPI